MRVAVEEAVDEDLLDHRPDERASELVGVEAGLTQRGRVGDLDPAHELHRQHPRSRQLVVDPRDRDVLEAGEVVRQPLRVVRLVAVVELLEDASRELVDEAAQADLPGDAQASLGDRGELGDDAEVGLGLRDDPRPLDLDRHGAVVGVARWTCAVDAAANGSCSIVANSSSGGRPSSFWITFRASSHGNGAASLWSLESSSISGGSTSLRLAIIWPIFT